MKKNLLVTLMLVAAGCSSSSDNPVSSDNALVGTWLSNCHEFIGASSPTNDTVYTVSELTITETGYVDNFVSYSDINCTADPMEESSEASYAVGENVATTDGAEATRITVTPIIPDRPDLVVDMEAIFRISGVELNFGEFMEGEVPSIDTRVTYIRQ